MFLGQSQKGLANVFLMYVFTCCLFAGLPLLCLFAMKGLQCQLFGSSKSGAYVLTML